MKHSAHMRLKTSSGLLPLLLCYTGSVVVYLKSAYLKMDYFYRASMRKFASECYF